MFTFVACFARKSPRCARGPMRRRRASKIEPNWDSPRVELEVSTAAGSGRLKSPTAMAARRALRGPCGPAMIDLLLNRVASSPDKEK